MTIGNPNHPVVRQAEHQWHKFAAILMLKFGADAVEITPADIERLSNSGDVAIVLDARGGRLVLRLVKATEGARLAREEGGLPH